MTTCPLCDQSFADPEVFVRHLADVHGLEDDPGTSSQTPITPTETEPIPRWAPITPSAEPAPAAAPPPPRVTFPAVAAPQPARGSYTTPIVAGVVAAVVLIGAIAYIASGSGSSTKATAASRAPVTTSTTRPTASASASALTVDLTPVVIHATDLSTPGFTTVTPPHEVGRIEASVPACVSPVDAGTGSLFVSEFTFELQQDGTEHGHVTSAAYAMDSLDTATALESWQASPAFQTCFEQAEASNLQDAFPGPGNTGTIDSVTSVPLTVGLPLPGNAYESTIHYHLLGFAEVATGRVYHLFKGQFSMSIHMNFCTCAPFPSDAVEQALLAAAARRMATLPS